MGRAKLTGQVGLGSQSLSCTSGGSQCCSRARSQCHPGDKWGWALCTHRWRCWGHGPVPAVLLQAGGGCGVTSAVQGLPPHPHFFLTPLGCWQRGLSHTVQDLLSHR